MANPKPTPLFEKALALHRAGKVGEAIQIYFMVLEAEPLNAEAFYRTALALCEAGGSEDGAAILQHAIKLNNKQARYHRLLGIARGRTGAFEAALASLDEAIALAPDKASFHADKADILVSAGDREAAVACYDRALALDPGSIADWLNRGATLIELERYEAAAESFDRVLALDPTYTLAHFNRGHMLLLLNRPKDALDSLRQGLARDPDNADALNNAALALLRLGNADDALTFTTQALKLSPGHARALLNRVTILLAQGQYADAVTVAEFAVATHPDLGEAHMLLGKAVQASGGARAQSGEAIAHFEKACALLPQSAEARLNLGIALYDLQRYDEAVAAYAQVLALAPDHARAHLNMANALHRLRRYREALTHDDRALSLEPAMDEAVRAHLRRADALRALDEPDAAEAALNQALRLDPDFVPAKWDKAQLYLSQGRFTDGWPLHGYRFAASTGTSPRPFKQRRWRGERVDGTLLAWAEQGAGEQILHASLVPDLLQRARSLVLEVEPGLVGLFARSFPEAKVVALGSELYAGEIDAQVSLVDAGASLRRDFTDFPARETGYLVADPDRIRALRMQLATGGRAVIGLSWLGDDPRSGESGSVPLRAFEALLRLPGIRFVDLNQSGAGADSDAIADELGITIERSSGIDTIDDLAALTAACDAVVSVSNTAAHLTGALGKPTWIVLPFGHAREWHWFSGRAQSPWYPRVEVRKQQDGEQWRDIIAALVPGVEAALDRRG